MTEYRLTPAKYRHVQVVVCLNRVRLDGYANSDEALAKLSELEKLQANPTYYSYEHQHHTYLSRGLYADQLPDWMQLFPKSQLLILKSEDLYANPGGTYNSVLEFLDLPPHQLEIYEKHNATQYPPVSETVYEQLRAYYRSPNQRLAQLCDRDFGWE